MSDPLFPTSKPEDELVPDYLGTRVPTSFKAQPALPAGGPAVGTSAGPSTVAGGGVKGANIGGGTAGGSSSSGAAPAAGPSTLAQIAKALGISEQALKGADVARGMFGSGAGETADKIDAGKIVPESASLVEGAGATASAIDQGLIVPESASLATPGSAAAGAGAGEAAGGSVGNWAAGVPRWAMGAYHSFADKGPDDQKALMALHNLGMGVADMYTFGLAELGPIIGEAIGKDNILGKMLIGAPAFLDDGPTHYQATRGRAGREAGLESKGLSAAYQQAANSGDLTQMLGALATEQGQKVRSDLYLSPEGAKALGLPAGFNSWRDLTPEQFGPLLDLYVSHPEQIELRGSGDVPYLPQGQAEQVASSAATGTHHFLDYAAQIRQMQQQAQATPEAPVVSQAAPQATQALEAMGMMPGGGGSTAGREQLGLEGQ